MWSSERRRLILSLAALAALPSCGFEPLYGEGAPARALSGRIEVDPIPGLLGFTLRERLISRLGEASAPAFRLTVDPETTTAERAIRGDNTITRFNLSATATYALTRSGQADPATTGTVRAFAAYSAVASPFATRAAEADARRRLANALADQIVLRLGATAMDP